VNVDRTCPVTSTSLTYTQSLTVRYINSLNIHNYHIPL